MKKIPFSPTLTLLCAFVLSLASGCGKKGPPEPPQGSTYEYPKQYPAEE